MDIRRPFTVAAFLLASYSAARPDCDCVVRREDAGRVTYIDYRRANREIYGNRPVDFIDRKINGKGIDIVNIYGEGFGWMESDISDVRNDIRQVATELDRTYKP